MATSRVDTLLPTTSDVLAVTRDTWAANARTGRYVAPNPMTTTWRLAKLMVTQAAPIVYLAEDIT